MLILAGVLFAEPLFLCTLLGALMLGTAAVDAGGARRAAMAGAAAAFAALVRSTGLVLLPAMVVALRLRRRPREAWIAAATGIACIVPWQLWSATATAQLSPPLRGNYGPYLAWFLDAVRDRGLPFVGAIARQNLVTLQRSAAIVFFPLGLREVRPLLVVLLAVVGSLGLMTAWRRTSAAVLFLVAYAVLVVAWPYAPDRFAWGVWPLVGIVLAAGAWRAWEHVVRPGAPAGERGAAGVLVGVALLAGMGAAFYTGRGVSRGWADVAQRRNAARLAPVVDWVRANTPPTAVVAADGDPLVALYTRRTVVPVQILSPDEYLGGTPPARAVEDLRALVDAGGADFAVLSGGSAVQDAARLLTTGSPRLVAVDTLPGGGMAFRVVRAPVRWPHTANAPLSTRRSR